MIVTTFQPQFIPLLRQVQDLGLVTVHAQFANLLHDADIAAQALNEFATPALRQQATLDAVKLLANLKDFDLTPLTTEVQEYILNGNLAAYFYERLGDTTAIIRTLDIAKPKLILVHNDVEPLNRVLALWAKVNAVPCLHIPHAIYIDSTGRGAVGSDVHDLVTASHIACAGPYQAQWYAERAVEAEILITGLPQFDRLTKPKLTRAQACKLLQLDERLPVVVYKSSWRQDTNLLGCHSGVEDSYQAFLAAALQRPELQYVISCHPRGNNLAWHQQVAEKAGLRAVITQEYLDILLTAADLFITYGPSNVILEAAALGNARLLMVDDTVAFQEVPEIAKCAADPLEIGAAIQALLSQAVPNYQNLVLTYLGLLDGNATTRVVELIRTLHG